MRSFRLSAAARRAGVAVTALLASLLFGAAIARAADTPPISLAVDFSKFVSKRGGDSATFWELRYKYDEVTEVVEGFSLQLQSKYELPGSRYVGLETQPGAQLGLHHPLSASVLSDDVVLLAEGGGRLFRIDSGLFDTDENHRPTGSADLAAWALPQPTTPDDAGALLNIRALEAWRAVLLYEKAVQLVNLTDGSVEWECPFLTAFNRREGPLFQFRDPLAWTTNYHPDSFRFGSHLLRRGGHVVVSSCFGVAFIGLATGEARYAQLTPRPLIVVPGVSPTALVVVDSGAYSDKPGSRWSNYFLIDIAANTFETGKLSTLEEGLALLPLVDAASRLEFASEWCDKLTWEGEVFH